MSHGGGGALGSEDQRKYMEEISTGEGLDYLPHSIGRVDTHAVKTTP